MTALLACAALAVVIVLVVAALAVAVDSFLHRDRKDEQ